MFRMGMLIAASALGVVLGGTASVTECQAPNRDGNLKLNQIQVIGTHTSYHAGIAPNEARLWQIKNPEGFKGLDYRHRALTSQLDSGVRQIELDIFADSQGRRFALPAGPRMVAEANLPPDPPFDPEGAMLKPGFKVMHMQDIDYRSVCQPFVACLKEVRMWSRAHPHHVPIFILVETKQSSREGTMELAPAEPFTPAVFDALDAEIRSVFAPEGLITPDDVRGPYATLNEAVLAGNWPTLKSARGKVMFLMDQRWQLQCMRRAIPPFEGASCSPTPFRAIPMPHSPSATTGRQIQFRSSCVLAIWSALALMTAPKRRASTTRADAMR